MQTGFFAAARRVVGQYGGVVEKYIGDAVMALFGAPVATETDAVRCVRAGLELQRVLARFAPDGADAACAFRVGVATGEALVDVAAARDGGQAIVAGDVVNTASRLQSVAPPGGVLVCGTTYALTKDAIRYARPAAGDAARPLHADRGVAGAWRRCSASTPTGSPTPPRWSTASTSWACWSTRCTGRCATGMPQVVTVLGRAGIGKSRLVRELFQHAERLIDEPVDLAHRPLPAVRRERHVRRAGRHRQGPGRHPRHRPGRRPPRSGSTPRCAELVGPAEAARLTDALGPLVGLPGPTLAAEEAESAWRRFLVALAARRPDRAGLRGPALGRRARCCASSSCSAPPPATCRCCCSAPPGRSWSTATRAGPARSPAR